MHIAQFNISIELAPLHDKSMEDFVNSLDRINRLAEQSEGFVWRLQDESGNATEIRAFDEKNIIFNLSTWRSIELLKKFTYESAHKEMLKRRRDWFAENPQQSYVLWWVPKNHYPTVEEAKSRLKLLQEKGESSEAFTFSKLFPKPE